MINYYIIYYLLLLYLLLRDDRNNNGKGPWLWNRRPKAGTKANCKESRVRTNHMGCGSSQVSSAANASYSLPNQKQYKRREQIKKARLEKQSRPDKSLSASKITSTVYRLHPDTRRRLKRKKRNCSTWLKEIHFCPLQIHPVINPIRTRP